MGRARSASKVRGCPEWVGDLMVRDRASCWVGAGTIVLLVGRRGASGGSGSR